MKGITIIAIIIIVYIGQYILKTYSIVRFNCLNEILKYSSLISGSFISCNLIINITIKQHLISNIPYLLQETNQNDLAVRVNYFKSTGSWFNAPDIKSIIVTETLRIQHLLLFTVNCTNCPSGYNFSWLLTRNP